MGGWIEFGGWEAGRIKLERLVKGWFEGSMTSYSQLARYPVKKKKKQRERKRDETCSSL